MKICIDIGHGKDRPNGVPDMSEYSFNSAVAEYLIPMLESVGVKVLLTQKPHTADDVPLRERSSAANREEVDFLVSIHADANPSPDPRGYWVFYWHNSTQGEKLAKIWWEKAQELLSSKIPPRRIVESKTGKWSNFHMLRETAMPAILIEHGFMTNPKDLEILQTKNYREKCAKAIFLTVCEYYDIKPNTKTKNKTFIKGKPQATIKQAQKWAKNRGAHQRFIDIAPVYWEFGEKTNIRPEVLYCQSAKETAFGNYGGVVSPDFNNWCGLKIRAGGPCSSPEAHESFQNEKEGVRAHFNHINAYIGNEPLGEPHGRYYLVKTIDWAGTVEYVEDLGAKWAPNPDYGNSIVRDYLTNLLNTPQPEEPEEEKEACQKCQALLDKIQEELEKRKAIKEKAGEIIKKTGL